MTFWSYSEMPEELRTTTLRVLLAVVAAYERRGYGPSHDELVGQVGVGRSVVNHHLVRLRRAGFLTWERGRHGTIRPLVGVVR